MRKRRTALFSSVLVLAGAGLGALTLPSSPSSAAGTTLLINAGGGSVHDAAGRTWLADKGFMGGWTHSTSHGIAGTTAPALFKTTRDGLTGYAIPVTAPGKYRVTLGMAENYWNARGKRVFSVQAEGRTVLRNIDIFAGVGRYKALARSFDVPVSDGRLSLRFPATADSASIATLSVTRLSTTGSTGGGSTPSAPATGSSHCTRTMGAGGSINTFINGLRPGQVGCLPGGTYTGGNVEMGKSGTSTAPITIQSVPGQRAKLKMRMSVTSGWVVFRGLDFDTDHQLGTSNAWIKSSAHDVTFVANEFADSGLSGTSAHDGQCLYSDYGSARVRILRNYFHDCGSMEQFHHSMYLNGTGYRIANNLVLRSKAWGIHLYPELDNSLVANNTVDGSGRAGIIVASSSHGNRIVNNIVSNNKQGGIDGYAVTGSNVVQNNLCYGNGSFCVESGDGFTGTGNVTANPLYVNRSGGNFHTAASSPAVGTANRSYAIGPDKDGRARPLGGGPDKGAYER